MTSERSENRKIPSFDKIGYGLGNFGGGVAMQIVGTYLVFYCTAILKIPGGLVGLAVSIGIIWDAVTDPVMGYLSDKTRSERFGRRHQYLLIGGIGIGISNYFLWSVPPEWSTTMKFATVLFILLLIKTFMTIYITPYTALGAEMSSDYDERTTIQSIKTIFFLLGLGFVSVFGLYVVFRPRPEYPIGQMNPAAYREMGLIGSIITVIFALLCYYATRKYIGILKKHEIPRDQGGIAAVLKSFGQVFRNRTFRYIAFCYMFINIASAFLSNVGLHVFTYTFGLKSGHIAFILGTQFLFSIISQPFWSYVSKRLDKKPSVMLGLGISILSSAIFIVTVLLRNQVNGNMYAFLPFAILAGFGTGGLFTLPLSMMADVIDLDELETGERKEGTYYGSLTLFYKLSQSITLFIIGIVLDLIRFDADLPAQAELTIVVLGMLLGVGTIVSFLFSALSVNKYHIDKALVIRIQQQIANRKAN